MSPLCPAALTPLAPVPDWSRLDQFQGTITRDDFLYLLTKVYVPGDGWQKFIKVGDTEAQIVTRPGKDPFILKFAINRESAKAVPSYWRGKAQIPAPSDSEKPLEGVRIALDPGHIGGSWAKMEERWFQLGKSKPVTEGDMTLLVAKMLVHPLETLGAKVYLTRSKPAPVTASRPDSMKKAAIDSLTDKEKPRTSDNIKSESELLFYRVSEIRQRAKIVNESIKPDLVLCLHFNAEGWGDEKRPKLVDVHHLHFLITGAMSAEEIAYEDQRFDMLMKLLNRTFSEELAVTQSISRAMAKETGLPPYTYVQANAIPVGDNPYIWARNLLANRLFHCPVVYLEPYVMNSKADFARIQAGDYDGRRNFGGVLRKSIYREYADGIIAGLRAYYEKRTP